MSDAPLLVRDKYPKDTIGYDYLMCRALFGEDSPASKWLLKKAAESPNGLDEEVVAEESQRVHLLARMHFGNDPS